MGSKPRSFVVDILKEAPRELHFRIAILILALLLLSLSQGILVALLEPLMKVMFALNTAGEMMSLKELVPTHLHPYFSDIDQEIMVEYVLFGIPFGLFVAGFIRSLTTY